MKNDINKGQLCISTNDKDVLTIASDHKEFVPFNSGRIIVW
jgi:hypothetical protein